MAEETWSDAPSGGGAETWKDAPAQASAGDIAADVGKSFATGAGVNFPIAMAGLPGDVGSLLNRGVDWTLGKAADVTGVEALRPPERWQTPSEGPMFGSQQIRRGVESVTGPLYQPQTTYGKYAQTIGEFAPLALTGPGGFGTRMLRQAVVPGALSETAGLATEGTPYEPYARAAGALAGGIPGVAKGERAVSEAARGRLFGDIEKGTQQFYDVLDNATRNVPFTPQIEMRLKTQLRQDLAAKQLFPFNSKAAYDALDDLSQIKDVAGLIAWRRAMRKELYKKGLSDSAKIMTEGADAAIDAAMPMSQPASGFLREADREFSIGKMTENLSQRFEKAEGGTAAANSGANLDNKIRQALQKFKDDRRAWHSLTPTEQLKVNQIIDGKWDVNLLRRAANFLGGGGGLGHIVSSSIIGSIFGHSAGWSSFGAAPLLKHWENVLTRKRAHDLVSQIAEKSNFAQGMPVRPPSLLAQSPRTALYGALAPQRTSEGYPYYQAQ